MIDKLNKDFGDEGARVKINEIIDYVNALDLKTELIRKACNIDLDKVEIINTEKAERCPVTKDFIQEHYDEFLGYYYNLPCDGCKDGHPSFWKTIVESDEWKAWEASRPSYDFAECEELGIMGKEHFKAFIDFIRTGKLSTSGISELKIKDIILSWMGGATYTGDLNIDELAHAIKERI